MAATKYCKGSPTRGSHMWGRKPGDPREFCVWCDESIPMRPMRRPEVQEISFDLVESDPGLVAKVFGNEPE